MLPPPQPQPPPPLLFGVPHAPFAHSPGSPPANAGAATSPRAIVERTVIIIRAESLIVIPQILVWRLPCRWLCRRSMHWAYQPRVSDYGGAWIPSSTAKSEG